MIDADYGTFRTDFQADPRLRRLLGPGGPFQVKEQVIDGVTVRSFAQAPATIMDCFRGSQRYAERVQLVYGDTRSRAPVRPVTVEPATVQSDNRAVR